MSTRRIAPTREHEDALNLIETEFYGDAKVQAAFPHYIAHLSSQGIDEASWHDIRNNKPATLLHPTVPVSRHASVRSTSEQAAIRPRAEKAKT